MNEFNEKISGYEKKFKMDDRFKKDERIFRKY